MTKLDGGLLPVTPDDYRAVAHQRLPRFIFDYIDGGANDERTMARNVDDFASITLRQRVLRNVDGVDTQASMAGQPCAMPLALAPVGMAGMFARRGEVQASRAALNAGVPFTLSTVGICSLEEVQAATRQPFWFQLYMLRDRQAVSQLLTRAWQAGCRTLLFTVDLAVAGVRHRDHRNGLEATGLTAGWLRARQLVTRSSWLWDVGLRGRPHCFGNLSDRVPDPENLKAFKQWLDAQFDPGVTWDDIRWIRDQWQGRLYIKGILDPEDAELAASVGADGLVVSNHGGRQLDAVSSSVAMLPAIAQAVGHRMDVWLDGGVRSGVDVFKALALGAQGVLIGRPWVWALAAGGQEGVEACLKTFQQELRVAMALAGVTRIQDIGRQQLQVPPLPA